MVNKRAPMQGLFNVVYFNWHFYILMLLLVIAIVITNEIIQFISFEYLILVLFVFSFPIIISLSITYYIYDYSNLYNLDWLDKHAIQANSTVLIIHAGFDEISEFLMQKYPQTKIQVCHFYDPKLHTEISLKRAINKYPPNSNNISIKTTQLPFAKETFDRIVIFLAAHEIRNNQERMLFFRELKQILKKDGRIYITEHLRDLPNFLAYSIGFFHFFSKKTWLRNFEQSNLTLNQEI